VTNPPIRAGKATVYRIFDGARTHLRPGGRLYVVIGKKQGAPSAEHYLTEIFGQCTRIGRKSGFWILRCDLPATDEKG
jgi:16S rRNA (guanine1207-N2)-methyltransferase